MFVLQNVCSTKCLFYKMFVLQNVCSTKCLFYTMSIIQSVCSAKCLFYTMSVIQSVLQNVLLNKIKLVKVIFRTKIIWIKFAAPLLPKKINSKWVF